MINLENRIERDELIDDYFNKGYACDIREVYQAIVNTVADLEYANDERIKEIERLHSIIKEVREYIENTKMFTNGDEKEFTLKETWYGKELLEILDKENEK